jgi:hypothetical protein
MASADEESFPSRGAEIPSTHDLTGQVVMLENATKIEGTFSFVSKGTYRGKDVNISLIQ